MNSGGDIAFVGTLATGEQIMLARPGQAVVAVNPGFVSATRSYQGAVSINDGATIGARDRVSGSPPSGFLRLWQPPPVLGQTVSLRAGSGEAYDGFVSPPGINNGGLLAVATLAASTTRITLANNLGLVAQAIVNEPIRPAIADTGDVVLRRLGEVVLYRNALSQSLVLAPVTEFAVVGIAPDVSSSGAGIAFSARPTASGAVAHGGTDQLPGAYLAVRDGAATRILRLDWMREEGLPQTGQAAAHDFDGLCDPGETCVDRPSAIDNAGVVELAVDVNARMQVIHQQLGAVGLADDTFVVGFVASPTGGALWSHGWRPNQKALWMVRVDVDAESQLRATRPVVALQVGDTIDGGIVTDLDVWESMAPAAAGVGGPGEAPGDHQIAVWVSTAAGQRIIRGVHRDRDRDGISDAWEAQGIDADGDGSIDLPLHLPPFAADPNVRDLFLEVDALSGASVSSVPLLESFASAVETLAASSPPIRLRAATPTWLDDVIPITSANGDVPRWGDGPGVDDDFNDIKRGPNRTEAEACGTGAVGRFGSAADRASANCAAILLARSQATRYVLFARGYAENPFSSGVGELPGNDLMVTVSDWAVQPWAGRSCVGAPFNCAAPGGVARSVQWELESSTLAHELGHTIGLRHGGHDDINCKPNYFSLMNYGFQFQIHGPRPRRFAGATNALQLDENAIAEANGVGAFPAPWTGTFRKDAVSGWAPQAAASPVDFDGNGAISPVAQAINANDIAAGGCTSPAESILSPLRVRPDDQTILLDLRLANAVYAYSGLGPGGQELPPRLERTEAEVLAGDAAVDADGDGVGNGVDNCTFVANPAQADANANGVGDACEGAQVDDLFRNGFE